MRTKTPRPSDPARPTRWNGCRMVMALMAYFSAVSASVAAAAALVSADVPVEALITSF